MNHTIARLPFFYVTDEQLLSLCKIIVGDFNLHNNAIVLNPRWGKTKVLDYTEGGQCVKDEICFYHGIDSLYSITIDTPEGVMEITDYTYQKLKAALYNMGFIYLIERK